MLARAERFADGHLEETGDFSDAGLWFSFRSVDPGPAHQPFHLGGYEDPP